MGLFDGFVVILCVWGMILGALLLIVSESFGW